MILLRVSYTCTTQSTCMLVPLFPCSHDFVYDVVGRDAVTFGVFPHDFWRWVTLHRAVENTSFAIDTILIVGLHHETWWH